MTLLLGLLIVALAAFVALYATWLFIARLREGKSPTKSFLRWLLDLYDAALGLG